MAYQATQEIDGFTTSPDIDDESSVFESDVRTRMVEEVTFASQIETLRGQLNALSTAVNGYSTDAETAKTAAESAQTNANASANFKGSWASLTDSLSVPSSVYHDGLFWALLNYLDDVTTSEPGVTADWVEIPGKITAGDHITITDGEVDIQSYVITKSSTGSLSTSEVNNAMINNYGQSASMTLTLPTAADGMAFIFQVSTTGYAIHFDPASGDKIYLDGTALDDGDKISLTTPAVGDFVTMWTVQTGASSYDWIASSGPALWEDGGA